MEWYLYNTEYQNVSLTNAKKMHQKLKQYKTFQKRSRPLNYSKVYHICLTWSNGESKIWNIAVLGKINSRRAWYKTHFMKEFKMLHNMVSISIWISVSDF